MFKQEFCVQFKKKVVRLCICDFTNIL